MQDLTPFERFQIETYGNILPEKKSRFYSDEEQEEMQREERPFNEDEFNFSREN